MSKSKLSAGWCEYCGQPGYTEKHHIKTRGSGGGDMPENLIRLCVECHDAIHRHNIDRLELIQIVAQREDLAPEEVCTRINVPIPPEFPEVREIKKPPTLDELIQAYISLDERQNEYNFLKGQLLVALTESGVKKGWIASQVRSSVSQIKVLMQTYRAFPREDMRIPELTWYHHRLAAHTSNPEEWVVKAADNEWSTREMSQAIREETTIETKEEKAMKEARSTYNKAEKIIDEGGPPAEWLTEALQALVQE